MEGSGARAKKEEEKNGEARIWREEKGRSSITRILNKIVLAFILINSCMKYFCRNVKKWCLQFVGRCAATGDDPWSKCRFWRMQLHAGMFEQLSSCKNELIQVHRKGRKHDEHPKDRGEEGLEEIVENGGRGNWRRMKSKRIQGRGKRRKIRWKWTAERTKE